ncbi:MAG: V-type ATP synthase subunit B, partial [Treponemataceae bacterium]|nr:V-type ATP synthase subunit B [Treponemataceae bacterium]
MKGIEYRGINSVDGPIVVVKRSENAAYNEVVCVRDKFGEKRIGRVSDMNKNAVDVQIFGATTGIALDVNAVQFIGA